MRLINAETLERLFSAQIEQCVKAALDDALQDALTIDAVDAVPVVRCKDSKWCEFWDSCKEYKCWHIGDGKTITVDPDGYCSRGRQKEES